MSNSQVAEIVFPSNPADRKIISDAIREIVDSKTRMSAEKDLVKNIGSEIKDKYDIKPAMLNSWANDAYDLAKKAEKDAKAELLEEGFQLFVSGDKRLSGTSTGITVQQALERDQEKKDEIERERIKAEQEALAKIEAEKLEKEELANFGMDNDTDDESVALETQELVEEFDEIDSAPEITSSKYDVFNEDTDSVEDIFASL